MQRWVEAVRDLWAARRVADRELQKAAQAAADERNPFDLGHMLTHETVVEAGERFADDRFSAAIAELEQLITRLKASGDA